MTSFMIRLSGGALLCLPVMVAQAADTERTARTQKEDTLEVVASPFSDDGSTENTGSYTTKQMTTATGLPLSIKDTPQSVSVITRQQMDDLNATSLKEILRWSTGVSESNYDSERSSFNYRGFSVDNYQYDGVPTFFDSGYSGGESEIDAITLDHVEIVRGAAGLLNGNGNPGAAINLVRKKASSLSPFARAELSAGSWDRYRTTVDVGTPLNDEGTVRVRIAAAGERGRSFMERHQERKGTVYGTLEADLSSNTLLRLGADYQQNRPKTSTWGGALPTGWFSDGSEINWDRHYNGASDWSSWDTTLTTQFATLEHEFDNDWKGVVNYTHSRQAFDAKMAMSLGGLIDPATWAVQPSNPYAGRYEGYRDQHAIDMKLNGDFTLLGRSHKFVVGNSSAWQHSYSTYRSATYSQQFSGSLRDWNGGQGEPEWSDKMPQMDYRTRQIGVYGSADFSLTDRLDLVLGARFNSFKNTTTTTANKVTPFVGTVYKLTEQVSAYASYTDIFKDQNLLDSSGHYLAPIEGVNKEVGIKAALLDDRLNVSLSAFRITQDNLGVQDENAGDPNSLEQTYHESQGATSKGVEFELSGELAQGWNAQLGITHFSLKDKDKVNLNTEQPRTRINLFTTYQLTGALRDLTLGGGARWQSSIYANVTGANNGEFVDRKAEQGSYVLFDAMARYKLTPQTSVQLNLNNVFDEKYYSQANFYSTRNYGDPRNLMLTLKHEF
ncbi:TonB-dependent siderophore receptor [Serratia sp. AS12]|uniref:TonB-dependent siderophore receptor n=1 Tax=Serratia TaxID=613 RepID=UPI00020E9E26|nr:MULTISPECIES: TonB-dependent siderophore receptor [Serratia]AEF46793.1 TonB-dependent siderophore receptor [Serratia plymuthica AS9]AEF51745.1 TonB-dependent siderophore receptor [Serratia sp. AS12]AEG29452.1 TonB-dependent siderophore receptor [Serratia sp. AS13]